MLRLKLWFSSLGENSCAPAAVVSATLCARSMALMRFLCTVSHLWQGLVDGHLKFRERKDQLLSFLFPCVHGVHTIPALLRWGQVGPYRRCLTPLIFNHWWSNLSLGLGLSLLCFTWAFSFLGSSQEGMDGHGKLALLSGSALRTGVLSGNSAFFSVEIQSLQSFSSMSREDKKCSTTVLNDTLLAKCGTSASRWLNLENGSLVLRSVEKDDEGKYEFVFQNTTKKFTLEVLGKWLS